MKKFNLHKFFLDIAFWFQRRLTFNHKKDSLKNEAATKEKYFCIFPIGNFLTEHRTWLQFFEFCCIGAVGVGVNALVFVLCLTILPLWCAWFLGVFVASISNFILNKWLVFRNQ